MKSEDRIVNFYCGLCPHFRKYINSEYLGYCELKIKEVDLRLLAFKCTIERNLNCNINN
jgi:hypothetical protein